MIDKTMLEIKTIIKSNSINPEKDKLNYFVDEFLHYDNILKVKEKKIYVLATQSIPVLSLSTPSNKMLVLEAVRVLKEINKTIGVILSRIKELAIELREYTI